MNIYEGRISASLERIADSLESGVGQGAGVVAYGKLAYAVGELDRDLHKLSVGEIKGMLTGIKEKMHTLGDFV